MMSRVKASYERDTDIDELYEQICDLIDGFEGLEPEEKTIALLRVGTEYGSQMMGLNEYNYFLSRVLNLTLAIQAGKGVGTFEDLISGEILKEILH
jgi:hypothetical protein